MKLIVKNKKIRNSANLVLVTVTTQPYNNNNSVIYPWQYL